RKSPVHLGVENRVAAAYNIITEHRYKGRAFPVVINLVAGSNAGKKSVHSHARHKGQYGAGSLLTKNPSGVHIDKWSNLKCSRVSLRKAWPQLRECSNECQEPK